MTEEGVYARLDVKIFVATHDPPRKSLTDCSECYYGRHGRSSFTLADTYQSQAREVEYTAEGFSVAQQLDEIFSLTISGSLCGVRQHSAKCFDITRPLTRIDDVYDDSVKPGSSKAMSVRTLWRNSIENTFPCERRYARGH